MAEDDQLMPDNERYYLYRVESYLVHKYAPELVHEFKITLGRARLRREGAVLNDGNIIHSKEELLNRIQSDLAFNVPWKPKNTSHQRTSPERIDISSGYQKQFEEL